MYNCTTVYNDSDVAIYSYPPVSDGDVAELCDSCLELSGNLYTSLRKLVPSSSSDTTEHIDDWLTVHRSITLVDLQLDAQNSYLFTYNTFIKIL